MVLKTSTRQTIFLPVSASPSKLAMAYPHHFEASKHLIHKLMLQVVGLVDPLKLKPGDLVGVNKDSYLVLDTLPAEYDSRVKVRLHC